MSSPLLQKRAMLASPDYMALAEEPALGPDASSPRVGFMDWNQTLVPDFLRPLADLVAPLRRPIPKDATPLMRSLITEERNIQDQLDITLKRYLDYEFNGVIARPKGSPPVIEPADLRRNWGLIQRVKDAATVKDLPEVDRKFLIVQLKKAILANLSSQKNMPHHTLRQYTSLRQSQAVIADDIAMLEMVRDGQFPSDEQGFAEFVEQTKQERRGLKKNPLFVKAQADQQKLEDSVALDKLTLKEAVAFKLDAKALPDITFREWVLQERTIKVGTLTEEGKSKCDTYRDLAKLPDEERRAECAKRINRLKEEHAFKTYSISAMLESVDQRHQGIAGYRQHLEKEVKLLETCPDGSVLNKPLLMAFLNQNFGGHLDASYKELQERLSGQRARIDMAEKKEIRLPATELPKDERWGGNVQVSVSGLQEVVSFGNLKPGSQTTYRRELLGAMAKSDNLKDAIDRMQVDQLRPGQTSFKDQQTAIGSIQTVKGWDRKTDTPPPRRILIITGDDHNGVIRDPDEFVREMQKLYPGLKKEDFIIRRSPDQAQLEKDFASLEDFADKNKGAEVMVFINAHGNAKPHPTLTASQNKLQGAQQGVMLLQRGQYDPITGDEIRPPVELNEAFLKAQTKRLKKASSVHILIESCHSGAWITRHEPARPTLSGLPETMVG